MSASSGSSGRKAERPVLVVEGRGGLMEGVLRVVRHGGTVVVGRSRTCHVSLRQTRAFLHHPRPRDVMKSPAFRRVSRVHCEIAHVGNGRVEIRDLSANGTLVNGKPAPRTLVVEPENAPVYVELGDPENGRLYLRMADPSRVRVRRRARAT